MSTKQQILASTVIAAMILSFSSKPALAADKTNAEVQDGFYHVLRKSKTEHDVRPIKPEEKLLINDYQLAAADEQEAPDYVVVEKSPYIPLSLSESPLKEKDDKDRPSLLLKLATRQIDPLEQFTRKNLGETIAIIIGGNVVSTHKIKQPITGGLIQISRCSKHGCEVIYSHLEGKK